MPEVREVPGVPGVPVPEAPEVPGVPEVPEVPDGAVHRNGKRSVMALVSGTAGTGATGATGGTGGTGVTGGTGAKLAYCVRWPRCVALTLTLELNSTLSRSLPEAQLRVLRCARTLRFLTSLRVFDLTRPGRRRCACATGSGSVGSESAAEAI